MNNLTFNEAFMSSSTMEIIKNAKLSGNIRKTEWIYEKALEGFFMDIEEGDKATARRFADQIDSMITVLNSMYHENWDFNLIQEASGYIISIVILFPHITITNSKGNSHEIEDLIVNVPLRKFNIGSGSIVWGPSTIEGTRATLDYKEWFVGYEHSHLPTNKSENFSTVFYLSEFCLGKNTEIINQQEDLFIKYSPESFELFLWTLNSFVSWESLEGVPYISINKIGLGDEIYTRFISSEYRKYYRYMLEEITSLDVDFVFAENRYRIKQNDKFERFLHKTIVEHFPEYWKQLLVIKSGGTYYGYNFPEMLSEEELNERFKVNGETPYFYLRDRKIEFKVKPLVIERGLPDINNYKVHPKFIEYAAARFEEKLHEKAIRKSTIERYSQANNA